MKEEVRRQFIQIRKGIPNKENKSHLIFQKIIEHPKYQSARKIALYYPLEDEVSTLELIDYSLKLGKCVYLPKVEGDSLQFYEITSLDSLREGSFHVMEPSHLSKSLKGNVNLVIVPGVCFDFDKHRMGFGRGYYDRFLSTQKTYKIGICFREQYVDMIPYDSHDILMDEVITD